MKLKQEDYVVNIQSDMANIEESHKNLTAQLIDLQAQCRKIEEELLINKGRHEYCQYMLKNITDLDSPQQELTNENEVKPAIKKSK